MKHRLMTERTSINESFSIGEKKTKNKLSIKIRQSQKKRKKLCFSLVVVRPSLLKTCYHKHVR